MPPTTSLSATNPSYNSSERRAYLWAFEDGTSLYLRALSSEDSSDYGTLVLTGKNGEIKSTWRFSRSNATLKNEDRVSVSTRMGGTDQNGNEISHFVTLRTDYSAISAGRTTVSAEGGTHRPEVFRRIWIGSSVPTLRSANGQTLLRWHSQWAGKKSSSTVNGNWTGEIIDFVKIYAVR